MSRIGNLPVTIEQGVEVSINGNTVLVKGPKGELTYDVQDGITVKIEDGKIVVTRADDEKQTKAFHGLVRALLNNMVVGVSKGYEKKLEVIGVGYKAQSQGQTLTMNLGFSHPVIYEIMAGVSVSVVKEKNDIITVSGIDKTKVGQVAAQIRKFRPPEPYKGKGIRYTDEHVVRKEGKRVAG